ncbi:MAG: phosphoenolpyruvate-protein phosphotransferase system enzyme [Verrucomicrobiota bacterium]|jgi:phosphotransferase system enzyme I (PtsI)|nr:phosphoenolpyruvate-protein phosphotransferase system enzyme [Verrucomicrobiota bacterium]MDK2964212.1 phosphoenolpyruvate-protein phosphotransferase system enzyme [Verrucomicrobiota bacterium]
MKVVQGIVASSGISHGKAVVYVPPDLNFTPRSITHVEEEKRRLFNAVKKSIAELGDLKEKVLTNMGKEFAHIFRSQQTVLEDDTIINEIIEKITLDKWCAETAVKEVFTAYFTMFEELDDGDYNKARMADLQDVYKRLLRNLLGKEDVNLSDLAEHAIIVAEELFPSDTAMMDLEQICGMITERGGITSHVAILAKNLGIPAAVAVECATERIITDDEIYLDATDPEEAHVYINPDGTIRQKFEELRAQYEKRQTLLAQECHLEPVTLDGRRITVSVNIGSVEEIKNAIRLGGKSVGLFRSEFLFMKKKNLPDEKTQFQAYKTVAEAFRDGFVILRTLDIGGDKPVASISIPRETNPFLGYRAIRISLDQPHLFRQQLRAALRASAFGSLKMMFPMISGPNEVKQILRIIEEIKGELDGERVDYDKKMELGIMVEIPSAIFMIDALLKHIDFISIGTNDLTQYLLAADRMNEHIRDYYQPYHPAVFRAIARIVDAAHARNKWVGVCGELGGMPLAVPALIGLGVDELSMSAQTVPEIVHVIRHTSYQSARRLADRILAMDEESDIKTLLQRTQNDTKE